jgi:hypothetical protein
MESRKNYTTTLRQDIIKKLKMLAVEQDKRANDILEEAILDVIKKYSNSPE